LPELPEVVHEMAEQRDKLLTRSTSLDALSSMLDVEQLDSHQNSAAYSRPVRIFEFYDARAEDLHSGHGLGINVAVVAGRVYDARMYIVVAERDHPVQKGPVVLRARHPPAAMLAVERVSGMVAQDIERALRGCQARAQEKLDRFDSPLTGPPRNLMKMTEKECRLSQLLVGTPHSFGGCLVFHSGGSAFSNASHAARRVARHGVRSHAVPVALVGECSMPVV
jgi:hypothetical protein